MNKPKKLILTAGPSISKKELTYTQDAVKNGWLNNHNKYILEFEKKFAKYVGTKYAMTTSGGTGALHLALATFNLNPGDEVILPELTYFACSDVIVHNGLKPVFVDILDDTWCIDPLSIERSITKKTRAIMPVSIYGNPCEMDDILKISKKYKLKIIEDSCPAVGSTYKNKHVGSFGDFGAFSFQGAKILTTGFGGMLVTNNKSLYEKAKFLNNHGETNSKKFWQTEFGYSFEMSNIQAAFGLAQLERIDEFLKKKKQIFNWYSEKLTSHPLIRMNSVRNNQKTNYWMTSVVLTKKIEKRDYIIKKLREYNIDSRPFFYPISLFPMFKEINNPISRKICLGGINLPSGLNLSKNEVDYISESLIKILNNL